MRVRPQCASTCSAANALSTGTLARGRVCGLSVRLSADSHAAQRKRTPILARSHTCWQKRCTFPLAKRARERACRVSTWRMRWHGRPGPSSMLSSRTDLDAPTTQDLAFQDAHVTSKPSLWERNRALASKVHTLEQEVKTLSSDLVGRKARKLAAPRARAGKQGGPSMHRRMSWAKQALQQGLKLQSLVGRRGLAHEIPTKSVFYSVSMKDPISTQSLKSKAGDLNFVNQLKPGDYWKDPFERPFLHAPYPHDPSSTLAHTVTGDYASPATWGEIYHDKEAIDWCTENFPWFEDRMKCIAKIHSGGPILG